MDYFWTVKILGQGLKIFTFQLYKLVQEMLFKILEFSLLDPFLKSVVYHNKGLAVYT